MDSNLTELSYAEETGAYAATPVGTRASQVLTATGQPSNTQTCTIGARVYTFQTVLTNVAGNVLIGADTAATLANLAAAINLTGTPGTDYALATTVHPDVTAAVLSSQDVVVTAKACGTSYNAKATTETMSNATWAHDTLLGGTACMYGVGQKLAFKGESLKHNKEVVVDETIRSDRQIDEETLVGTNANGGIDAEFRIGEYWPLIGNGALMATIVSGAPTFSSVITVAANGSATLDGIVNAGLMGAKLIKITGAAHAGNNGLKAVASYATGVLTLPAGSMTGFTETAAITVTYCYARNGTTPHSYMIQKYGVTLATYLQYLGMCVDTFSFSAEAKKKASMSFGFIGYGAVRPADTEESAFAGGTVAAPYASSVLTGSNNMGKVLVDGVAPVATLKKLEFAIKNNLREKGALARLGTLLPGKGTADITGMVEAYFDDKTLLDSFLNHTTRSIYASFVDLVNPMAQIQGFSFHMPKVTFKEGNWNAGAINQDIMLPLSFRAVRDTTLGYEIQIDCIRGTP